MHEDPSLPHQFNSCCYVICFTPYRFYLIQSVTHCRTFIRAERHNSSRNLTFSKECSLFCIYQLFFFSSPFPIDKCFPRALRKLQFSPSKCPLEKSEHMTPMCVSTCLLQPLNIDTVLTCYQSLSTSSPQSIQSKHDHTGEISFVLETKMGMKKIFCCLG